MENNNIFGFEILEHIGIISPSENGWTKEVNLVSWSKNDAKIDIRNWDENHEKMSRGLTLTEEEAKTLAELLTDREKEKGYIFDAGYKGRYIKNKNGREYLCLEDKDNYLLLVQTNGKYAEFVVCYNWNNESKVWGSAEYFINVESASSYFTEKVKPYTNSFIGDAEKMRDFFELSKEDFLDTYNYLSEEDYKDTLKELYGVVKNKASDNTQYSLAALLSEDPDYKEPSLPKIKEFIKQRKSAYDTGGLSEIEEAMLINNVNKE